VSVLAAWQAAGKFANIFGEEIFYRVEGSAHPEPLLVLHGFPTCSLDFSRALPFLSATRRVVLHDHPGFGLSAKPKAYSYSLLEQAEVAVGLWRELGIRRGHLVAHDYGTSIATELLARRERGLLPFELLSVTFCNGSVHKELAQLRIIQQLLALPYVGPLTAKVTNRYLFQAQLRRLFGDPARVSKEDLDALWEALSTRDGALLLPQLSHYQEERVRFWERWIFPLTRLDLPAHILWGKKDPVAVPAIAERLVQEIPKARLTWLDEAGHYPMLEAPERFAEEVLRFLEAL
jgi:pimeloyl-ACP methyl ester carboxylesterase